MRAKPGVARQLDRAADVVGIVRAPEPGKHVRHHRLHAEAQPVDAGPEYVASLAASTLSGLHSTVTSAPSARSIASRMRAS